MEQLASSATFSCQHV